MHKKFFLFIVVFIAFIGIFFVYKAGRTITVVGSGGEEFWEEAAAQFSYLPEPEENRVDILLLGIRGYDGEWGDGEWLADTIILASFNKLNNKTALISIPRDLYVDIPDHGKDKINAVYSVGETRQYGGGGLALMKAVVSHITDVYVDHAVSIDFDGFQKIIDHLGGITIYRTTPFVESRQWIYDGKDGARYWRLNASIAESIEENIENVDLSNTSTTSIEDDLDDDILAEPLSENEEVSERDDIGWEFYVPAGTNTMNSEEALYYARSRYSSSDFDRMHRQQEVIGAIKSKALSLGVITNPVKIFNILDIVERNIRIDIDISTVRELVALAVDSKIQDFSNLVLDSHEETGLLIDGWANELYVLLPKAGDYSEIREEIKMIVE